MICESCGSRSGVYRSRPRSAFEAAMVLFTPYRAYRCHKCNWRTIRVQRPSHHLVDRLRIYAQAAALAAAAMGSAFGFYWLVFG